MTSLHRPSFGQRIFPLLALVVMLVYAGCSRQPASAPVANKVAAAPLHPLNPLDTNEIKLVKEVLLSEGKIDTTYRFYLINLNEPPKAEMLTYKEGDQFRREAFASVYDRATNTLLRLVTTTTDLSGSSAKTEPSI